MWSRCGDCKAWDWKRVSPDMAINQAGIEDREMIRDFLSRGFAQAYVCQGCGNLGFASTMPPTAVEEFVGKHPLGGARAAGGNRRVK